MKKEKIRVLDEPNWFPKGFTLRDLAKIPIENQWTREMVEERLIEAVRLAEDVIRNPFPDGAKSNWPKHRYEWSDLIAQVESPNDARKYGRLRNTASRKEIENMESALRWQTLYLNDHGGAARVLSAFLRARARRKSFIEIIKKNGWSKATAYRMRDRALTLIAVGLMRDKIFP